MSVIVQSEGSCSALPACQAGLNLLLSGVFLKICKPTFRFLSVKYFMLIIKLVEGDMQT